MSITQKSLVQIVCTSVASFVTVFDVCWTVHHCDN